MRLNKKENNNNKTKTKWLVSYLVTFIGDMLDKINTKLKVYARRKYDLIHSH